jgi:sterol desaturase/sphingolipid hydroxylase (fatty acid hydroxylase superfamily)
MGFLTTIFITAIVFIPLERLLALKPQQAIRRPHWGNDLVFLLVNGFPIKFGLLAVITTTALVSDRMIPGMRAGVSALPWWVQLPLAIVLSDLMFYWVHRAFHRFPSLWKFHAVHHSIEEMDWLAASRLHPVDQVMTKGAALIPVVALGFSDWVMGTYAFLYFWQTLLIHANVRLRFGPARFLIASPEFHHWHHSRAAEARDRNFAAQLPFLDILFGTMYMPRGRMPVSYGIDQPMRQNYLAQMIYPLLSTDAEQARREGEPQVKRAD